MILANWWNCIFQGNFHLTIFGKGHKHSPKGGFDLFFGKKKKIIVGCNQLSGRQGLFKQFFVCDNVKHSPTLFQNIVHFYPNFQIFSPFMPFLTFFAPFLTFFRKIAHMPLLSRIDLGCINFLHPVRHS